MRPLGSYSPDLADSNAGISTKATNVIVARDSNGLAHQPHPSLSVADSATALPDAPRGGVAAVDSTGSYAGFFGTTTNIYKMSAAFELDAGQSVGSGYSLPGGDHWSFARFKSYLHATNTTDGLLKFNVDSDSSFSAVSGAPSFRYIFSAFNTLIGLDTDGNNRVIRNSAIGNSLIWEGKGSGEHVVPNGEDLMCGVELNPDMAIVFQRNAIRGLYRRNDGQLFDIRLLYPNRGCVNPKAMCAVDGMAFFIDNDGLYRIGADGGLTNVGKDKVNRTFLASLATDGKDSVELTPDRERNRIIIRYRSSDVASTTIFEDALSYDYRIDEFAPMEVSTAGFYVMGVSAYTVDDLNFLGPLETIDIEVDSRYWSGGDPQLGAIDENLKFGFFTGTSLAATSETSAYVNDRSVRVKSVTALTDAENGTVRALTRDRLADTATVGDAVTMTASGSYPVDARGKIIAYRFEVAAGETWDSFRGFDFEEYRAGGKR